jgi:hypothetical protein
LERARRVIPPDACLDTPPHLDEFDPSYIRNYDEDVEEKRANDTHQHLVVDYMGKQKMVKESREENPYWCQRTWVLIIDFGVSSFQLLYLSHFRQQEIQDCEDEVH